MVAAFDELQLAILGTAETKELKLGWALDSRLTSLETVDSRYRSIILDVAVQMPRRARLFPPELVAVAALYEDFPGAWLVSEPWTGAEAIAPEEAATMLAQAIVAAVQDANALVKVPVIRWGLATGLVTMAEPLRGEILSYPEVGERRSATEAVIRSSFLATKSLDSRPGPDPTETGIAWARSFWSQNWHGTQCLPEEEAEEEPATHGDDGSARAGGQNVADGSAESQPVDPPAAPIGEAGDPSGEPVDAAVVDDDLASSAADVAVNLFNSFLNAVLDPALPVDLHRPECHEVLTGLVSRAARATIRTLHHPDLWSGEHGMTTMRILAETEIVMRWMGASPDPEIYAKYQDYGYGKRKLMRRHFETLRAEFDAPSDFLGGVSSSFETVTGGDWGEEFQAVSVERTFAAKDLRQMAAEVGLEDLYRHVFQPASGISHGEWWAVEDYAMQRCLNPLHRFHLIPSFRLQYPTTAEFPVLLQGNLRRVMKTAVELLAPDPSAHTHDECQAGSNVDGMEPDDPPSA